MLKKVDVVEKVIKVFNTSELKVGDPYIMTVGDNGLEICDDVLSAEKELFILIESFTEHEIKAVYISRSTTETEVQRFTITPDMDVTLERVIVW